MIDKVSLWSLIGHWAIGALTLGSGFDIQIEICLSWSRIFDDIMYSVEIWECRLTLCIYDVKYFKNLRYGYRYHICLKNYVLWQ